jgi:hypothetical protein
LQILEKSIVHLHQLKDQLALLANVLLHTREVGFDASEIRRRRGT